MSTVVASLIPDKAGVSIVVTFPVTVTKVTVSRHDMNGTITVIRQGESLPLVNGTATVEDYEAPLDLAFNYEAVQITPAGTDKATSNTITVPSGQMGWLKDPGQPGAALQLKIITSIESLSRASRSGVFDILDRARPIVVSGVRGSATGQLVCHTLSDQERTAMHGLLDRGTVLLLQTPDPYGFGSRYVAIADVEESRVGLAMEQARRWTLPFIVVDRPEGLAAQPSSAKTWQAVKDTYPTWGDLAASGKSWRTLLEEGP